MTKEIYRCQFCRGEIDDLEAHTLPYDLMIGEVTPLVIRCPHCERESDTWLVEEVDE